MANRVNSITLVLEQDIRVDDAEQLISACRQLRGVLDVRANVVDTSAAVVESRVRIDVARSLQQMAQDVLLGKPLAGGEA